MCFDQCLVDYTTTNTFTSQTRNAWMLAFLSCILLYKSTCAVWMVSQNDTVLLSASFSLSLGKLVFQLSSNSNI